MTDHKKLISRLRKHYNSVNNSIAKEEDATRLEKLEKKRDEIGAKLEKLLSMYTGFKRIAQ